MAGNALRKTEERRQFRRVSDAVALAVSLESAQKVDFDLPDYPTHVVSLSPSGIKYFHDEAFELGDTVSIGFVIFPSMDRIDVRAKVVNVGEEMDKSKQNRFFAGMAFEDLSADDEKILLDHISQIAKQSFGGTVKLINTNS